MSQIPVDLKFLLRLYGVASSYRDAWGATKFVAPKVLMQVLSRLGVPCNTIEERKHSLTVAKKQIASRALPPVILWEEGKATQHTILSLPARLGAPDAKSLTLRCQLIAVDGCSGESTEPEPIQTWEFVSDQRTLVRARLLGRERLFRHRLSFEGALAAGYYRLEVLRAHDASLIGSARVIVSPRRCFLPQQLENERPIWGLAAQLYSLWRDEGQLIGDFPSLRRLLQAAEAHGASFVGLNPLHAIPLTNNATWSPYAPLSRELLNILYIGVEEVPEWALLSDVERAQFKSVRVSTALIDYQQAAE